MRDDVGGADPRVRPSVLAQVDPLAGDVDPGDERLDELVPVADEGEHRAVVVGVGVDVEQAGVRPERLADRVDRRPLAALGEVRHRLERQHAPMLTYAGTMPQPEGASYRTTFFRLLGFLRGYKLTLSLSVVLAVVSASSARSRSRR